MSQTTRSVFDAIRFLKDYQIPTRESGENCSPFWINTCCPFCNDTNFHLGFNLETGYCHCWKCGKLDTIEVISTLLGVSKEKAKRIFLNYYQNSQASYRKFTKGNGKGTASKVVLPSNAGDLLACHRKYLESRNYDSDYLQEKYKIAGTNHIGEYKWRVIIPIFYKKKLVSYQGRDITSRSTLRYKACKNELEVIHHKDIFYDIDNATKDSVIIVEGIFDKWRIGDDCVASFGVSFTQEQVVFISKTWKRVFILYDKDEAGLSKADKLSRQLSGLPIEVEIVTLDEGDPGSMSDTDAKHLRKELLK